MPDDRHFALVLHDVAPATWPACADFVAEVDERFGIPLTLLVVPDFHRQGAFENDRDFVATLNARRARGDELVLHGYHHDDPGPIPPSPHQYLMRRVLTHEGEFLALSADEARARLAKGVDLFRRLGWPIRGFVPPAWLLGKAARSVLADFPFTYTSHPNALLRLPSFAPLAAPTLVFSARSAWRRGLSRLWNGRRLRRHADAGLIRLGVHPVDLGFASVRRFWLETLAILLATRRAITKQAWLEGQA